MIHHLVHLGISPAEKAIRTVAVYGALLLLLHLAGKRQLAQLNSFDLVVLLLLSNGVQNAVIGNDNSLLGEPEGVFNPTPKPRPALADMMRKLEAIEQTLAQPRP